METRVDIPDDDIRWIDNRAVIEGKSREAVLLDAISKYKNSSNSSGIEKAFGLWRDRPKEDAVNWQRRVRAEWTRPWDFDYDEVRAEFPDLFDPEDDREREYWRARGL
jgi:hypothetical protein